MSEVRRRQARQVETVEGAASRSTATPRSRSACSWLGAALAHPRRRARARPAAAGLRELAEASGVNVNTVRAVYQRLEQEGLIDSQQGSGTFVAARATASLGGRARSRPTQRAKRARPASTRARSPPPCMSHPSRRPPQRAQAASERRRLLRAQIATLERALGGARSRIPGHRAGALAVAPRASARRCSAPSSSSRCATALDAPPGDVQTAIDEQLEQTAGRSEPPATRAPATQPERARPGGEARRSVQAQLRERAQARPTRASAGRPAPAGT